MGKTLRKADEVALTLLDQIVKGELEVGSLLPKESEIAEQFGVNRGVVREANKLLEVHRLVRPIRRRGTEVLDPMRSLTPEVLRAMLVDRQGQVDVAMLGHFLELRALLDTRMVEIAAERRSEEDLQRLEAVVGELEAALGDPEAFAESLHEFGLALSQATGNPIFVMLSHWNRQIHEYLEPVLAASRPPSEPRVQAIRALVDAIRQQDIELVSATLRQFHEWANAEILATAAPSR